MHTIFYGGDIVTLNEELYTEAVLVEDGIIKACGTLKELTAMVPDAKMYDLRSQCMIPAFIDPHSHITSYANTLSLAQLAETTSIEEMVERLQAFKERYKVKPGEWIIGFGYDHNYLPGKKQPTKMDFDVFSENPVVLAHASGHMGVMNSKGLEVCGITKETKDPEGGHIGRMEGSLEPDGYLEENAFFQSAGSLLRKTREQSLEELKTAGNLYLYYGITTVQEGMLTPPAFELLKEANAKGELIIDVIAYPDLKNCKDMVEKEAEYVKKYVNHLKIGGYKIFLDGSPQGRTAWLTSPYEKKDGEEEGYLGYPIYEKDQDVIDFVVTAMEEKMQLLTHCNGDAAADQLIRCIKKAMEETKSDYDIRPVMIHAQTVRHDQIDQMNEIHMIPSFFVAHTWYWGDVHLENLGTKRGSHISPVGYASKNGVIYTLHQDTPVIAPNMLETIWCAVNRITKTGVPLSYEECVTPLEALLGVTKYAAYQYFEEDTKGTISVGKRADFAILSENPLKVEPMKIEQITVMATIKDGMEVYKKVDKADVLD